MIGFLFKAMIEYANFERIFTTFLWLPHILMITKLHPFSRAGENKTKQQQQLNNPVPCHWKKNRPWVTSEVSSQLCKNQMLWLWARQLSIFYLCCLLCVNQEALWTWFFLFLFFFTPINVMTLSAKVTIGLVTPQTLKKRKYQTLKPVCKFIEN